MKTLLHLAVTALLASACSDYGSSNQDPKPDAGQDAHTTGDGSTEPGDTDPADSGPADSDRPFCSGAPRVEHFGQLYHPVDVTSERLVMDCCDGAILTFHLSEQLGFDVIVNMRFFMMLAPGEYQLPLDGAETEVYLVTTGEPHEFNPLTGTLRITGQDNAAEPLKLTLCAHTTSEDPMDLHLWVEDFPVIPWEWWEAFAVYRLEDPSIDASEAAGLPLESLELYFQPLLDLGTLSYYDAQSHTLVLGLWRTAEYVRNQLPEMTTRGLPFVVTVHGEPIYLGAFFSNFSSESFAHPVIIIDPPSNTNDRLVIDRSYAGFVPPDEPDPRADPRLFELLRNAGKLKP